jgi:hypothetical protein
MNLPPKRVDLSRTELDFLKRLLLDLQGGPADGEQVAAIEVALAMLQWDGAMPPELDAQVGLGAAIQLKLGADAMCAYTQWRAERRRLAVGCNGGVAARTHPTT